MQKLTTKKVRELMEYYLQKMHQRWLQHKEGQEYWKLANEIRFSYEHDDYIYYRFYFNDIYITFFVSKSDKKIFKINSAQIGNQKVSTCVKSKNYIYMNLLNDMIYDFWDHGALDYIKHLMKKNSEKGEQIELLAS